MGMRESEPLDPMIFYLVGRLSERMFALEVEHYGLEGEQLDDHALTSPYLLHVLGRVSQFADVDGPSQLSACICLAYVRWSLLKLCQKAFEKKMPTLSEYEVPTFFRETVPSSFRLRDRHPSALLLLLITGTYNDLGTSLMRWTHEPTTVQSKYLTMNLMSSLFDDFTSYLDTVLGNPQPKTNTDHRALPSADFVRVLRSAGLNAWLEPGTQFDTEPCDGPHYHFLTRIPAGAECLVGLQNLARQVDFAAYFERAAQSMARRQSAAMSPVLPSPITLGSRLAIPRAGTRLHRMPNAYSARTVPLEERRLATMEPIHSRSTPTRQTPAPTSVEGHSWSMPHNALQGLTEAGVVRTSSGIGNEEADDAPAESRSGLRKVVVAKDRR
ncbi:hypothetical protein PENSPDRAFT_667277 [Peniophora sp. CONT]|nr:hypothetical protein PENSPDRAFT_667277 [Peniophora sp. CONT]